MDREALTAEQTELRRLLKKRENIAGFTTNVEMIKARLAAIEPLLAVPDILLPESE